MTSNKKAIALVSGGMDSLLSLAIAQQTYDVSALHILYGQRTEDRELKSFHDICHHYNISNKLITNIDFLSQIGGSSLTDTSIKVEDADLESEVIPTSYVPFRNAHFIVNAVSWAEVINAEAIFIGAVAEDSSGYPDCRQEFYDLFEKTIDSGTRPDTKIRIITPVINMKKSEIILKSIELKVPLEHTWSCYKNSEKACGICDSCALRLRAFKDAGLTDPIEYEVSHK